MLKLSKRGFEAPWWAFLAGLIIAIVVIILLLIFIGKIRVGGETQIGEIGRIIRDLFR